MVETSDPPLLADHPEIPKEHALQGFDSVRVYAADPEQSRRFFEETLAFRPAADGVWESRGDARGSLYIVDRTADRERAAPARSTTSPGPRRWTSTRPGESASPRAAAGRRR